ncbi:glycosyltransferase family 2 protein [candidate division WOR-3 bacterium]|nr:glycosyltransferase family 2 protein [candidate division WOR-3 bacterium]
MFFPVYNDWGTIGSMVALAVSTAESLTKKYEIILVDDGSNARTKQILSILEKQFNKVRVIHHPKNMGYGAAIRTGISNCKYEYIFYTDGDAQYDVSEIKNLLPFMRCNIDMVNGYKIKRMDPLYRVIIGRLYHYIVKFAFGLPLRDVDCDFRLMRRSIFNKVNLVSDSGVICVEMIKKIHNAGFKFAEVPVHHYYRMSGKSQFFSLRRLLRIGKDLLKLWVSLVFYSKTSRK